MKAIGYFREPAGAASTLGQQNKSFLDFCAQHGYEVAGTFADCASSNGHAPGFRELVVFLRAHDGDELIVVIADLQTLGSDLRDTAVRLFQIEGLGARISPMTGAADAESELMSAWTSQDGPGRLSDRVRAAMRRKAVKGEVLGRPPYGYKVGNRRRLELVPEEAVVVRYIFRLYLHEGLGIRLIARRLNEEELRTRRGGNWSMVSIRDILRNRAYLGTYSRFGVRVPGSHPSLVANDDFKLVQDRLNARRTSYAPRVAGQFLLSGLAHCGYCGNKLIGVSRKQAWKRQSGEVVSNSYRYYQCESRTNQSVCSYHTRRADDLEAAVRDGLARAVRDDVSDVDDEAGSSAEDLPRDVEKLRARIRSLDRKLETHIDDAAKGRLTRDKMHALSIAAAGERLRVEDQLDAIERVAGGRISGAERRRARDAAVTQIAATWCDGTFDTRQSALREVLGRVTVTDDAITLVLRT